MVEEDLLSSIEDRFSGITEKANRHYVKLKFESRKEKVLVLFDKIRRKLKQEKVKFTSLMHVEHLLTEHHVRYTLP